MDSLTTLDADAQPPTKRLMEEVEEQYRKGWHTAAQLTVRYRGRIMLNCVSSHTDDRHGPPATTNSPFLVFSIGKILLALCIHHLAESNRIDLDSAVADYWPEFSSFGKHRVTVRHVLLHQAGIPKSCFFRHLFSRADVHARKQCVARARPVQQPGGSSAYHPLNYGCILGELLRRVADTSPQAYLREHFLSPMGLGGVTWEPTDEQLRAVPKIFAAHASQWPAAWVFNRLRTHHIVNPGFNLYGSANALSAIMQMLVNGGQYNGHRILREETILSAIQLRYRGLDRTIGRQTLWAEGFHLGGSKPEHKQRPGPAMGRRSTTRTFGHCGHMSSIVWADPEHQLVMAFTCNGLLSGKAAAYRWQRLADLTWELVGG